MARKKEYKDNLVCPHCKKLVSKEGETDAIKEFCHGRVEEWEEYNKMDFACWDCGKEFEIELKLQYHTRKYTK
ncbi:MAG TPA: hypothetical protein PK079_26345 [Leptospiraceae bacterium]|nr:hypothetical protein [Leptospiraceae bacterium]HNE11181.1 hypothetical protein [Leptospiraceae bacterium]HNE56711.1 hypothetical protein [Leptospiraceae bacterium]